VRTLLRFAFLLIASSAGASVREAVLASTILRDLAESRVIGLMLDGQPPGGETYAVAFAFENVLWCYSAEYGNRMLGTSGSSWCDAEALKTRLRRTGLPVSQVTLYAAVRRPSTDGGQVLLNNACVIATLAALRERLLGDPRPHEAGLVLLSYQAEDAERAATLLVDHCVLVVREAKQWRCIDPSRPDTSVPLANLEVGAPLDPALLTISLRSQYPLKSARLLRIEPGTLEQITAATLWRRRRHTDADAP
jgi:hypothetical protein